MPGIFTEKLAILFKTTSKLKDPQFTEGMSWIILEIKAASANSKNADIRIHEALLASLYIQIAVKIKLPILNLKKIGRPK